MRCVAHGSFTHSFVKFRRQTKFGSGYYVGSTLQLSLASTDMYVASNIFADIMSEDHSTNAMSVVRARMYDSIRIAVKVTIQLIRLVYNQITKLTLA